MAIRAVRLERSDWRACAARGSEAQSRGGPHPHVGRLINSPSTAAASYGSRSGNTLMPRAECRCHCAEEEDPPIRAAVPVA